MDAPTPDSPENRPAPEEPLRQNGSDSLTQLFIESFFLMGRYFVIVYPVFLYFILSGFLVPQAAIPDFSQWAWWVVSIGLLAILFIFKAGWNAMMYKAVTEWQDLRHRVFEKKEDVPREELQRIPFGLLKEFIPGMGQYGVPFLVGGGIWFVAACMLAGLMMWLGYHFIGIPEFITTALSNPEAPGKGAQHLIETMSTMDQAQFMQMLSAQERTQLDRWYLILIGIFILLAALNALTLFWQQYLIIKQCNPFKAFFYSGRQAIRHPFQAMVILFYFSIFMLSFSLMEKSGGLGAFLGEFLLILTIVFFGLFLFLYLLRVDVEPQS